MSDLIVRLRELSQMPHDVAGATDDIMKAATTIASAQHLEDAVADFLDAYAAFNNDDLDEVALNDAEHAMKLAMYSFREDRK